MNQDDVTQEMFPHSFKLKDGRACTLRLVTEDDAEEVLAFLPRTHIETDFVNYFPGEFDMSVEQEKEFIRNHTGKPGMLALAAVVDGRIVAVGGAEQAPYRRYRHQTEIGLVVLEDFWGRGIGRTIMECLIAWGRRIGLRKMCLRTFAENTQAQDLYESLGFVEEGRLKGDRQRRDGGFGDTILMAKFYAE